LFGRTQYCFGAVVLTLKHMRFFDGLLSFRSAVTTSVNGPKQNNVVQQYAGSHKLKCSQRLVAQAKNYKNVTK